MTSPGQPLRAALRAGRRLLYRTLSPIDRQINRHAGPLLPPAYLRHYYYGTLKPSVFATACDNARAELVLQGLRPDDRVLDIGSGIGNLAIALIPDHRGGYDGVEIHRDAVDWCARTIQSRHPDFRFHRADVSSVAYNGSGEVDPARYGFPFADATFDIVYLGSVFTHMFAPDVRHYLREIGRLLRPGGRCICSTFLLNASTEAGIKSGASFMSFDHPHASGVCWIHDLAVPEAAIALNEVFVHDSHAAAGLRITNIRRGSWATGGVNDQDVITSVAAG